MINRIDGGVSQNDFIMQLLADLTGLEVERPINVEMSIFGVAICAGLYCGMILNFACIYVRTNVQERRGTSSKLS